VEIREFKYPEDLIPTRQLWESIEKGINLGLSDEPGEIEKKLKRDPDLFILAISEGRVVGSVIGGFDGRRGMIYHLAVSAQFRHRGLGSKLMAEIENRLRAKGCIRSYLMVTRENAEAMQFYFERGWERMDFIVPFAKNL